MMNWVPIVGSSFDSVGGQLYNWQNFDRATRESNIARMNARDAAEQNYFSNLANLRRADAQRKEALMIQEQDRADRMRQAAEQSRLQQYQFGQTMGLERERMASAEREHSAKIKEAEDIASEKYKFKSQQARAEEKMQEQQQVNALNAAVLGYMNNPKNKKTKLDDKGQPVIDPATKQPVKSVDVNDGVIQQAMAAVGAKAPLSPNIYWDNGTKQFKAYSGLGYYGERDTDGRSSFGSPSVAPAMPEPATPSTPEKPIVVPPSAGYFSPGVHVNPESGMGYSFGSPKTFSPSSVPDVASGVKVWRRGPDGKLFLAN